MSNRPTRMVLVTNDAERAAVVEQIAVTNGWQILPCVRRPVPFELLDHLRIDLFLVDLDLENAFEQVRELARRPGAKVIALASPEKIGNWHDAIQAGAKELISLPLEPQNLVTTIHQVCSGGSSSFLSNKSTQSTVSPPLQPAGPSNSYASNNGTNGLPGVHSSVHQNNSLMPNGNGFGSGSTPPVNQPQPQPLMQTPQFAPNHPLPQMPSPGQLMNGQQVPPNQAIQYQPPLSQPAIGQPGSGQPMPEQSFPQQPPYGQTLPGQPFQHQPMPQVVPPSQPMPGLPYPQQPQGGQLGPAQPSLHSPPPAQAMQGQTYAHQMPQSQPSYGQTVLPAPAYTQPLSNVPSYVQPSQQPIPQLSTGYHGHSAHNAGMANAYNNGYLNGQMSNGAMPNGYTPQATSRVIAVTGLRGGVGRSTIAANLAVALRQRNNSSVILVEAHHGLGHLALMLNLLPRHTLASITEGESIDTDVMKGVLQQHSSGVQLLSAPLDVTQLVEFSPETWRHVLSLVKQMGQYVVIDTSAYADAVLSEVLTVADEILIICGPDILSMRSTMSMLETVRGERDTVRGRVQLLLNRAGVRGGLDESTLQKQLREKIVVSLTDDAPLATYALNRGVPFVLSHGRSALTRSITTLVDQFSAGAQVTSAPAQRKPFALLPLLSRG